jgi:ligand-binding sensor domain-containing protein/signal transduction histidine kinase
VLFLAAVASPPEAADARRLPARVFKVEDGLPHDRIRCVMEDSRGFLWIGTGDGLARFDGSRFVSYGVAEGLPHPGVEDILEVPDGSLWLATGAGVVRFDVNESPALPSAFRTFRLGEDLGSNKVRRIHRDRAGRIWAGAAWGLFVLEPGTDRFRRVSIDLPKPPVPMINAGAFAQGPGGELWVGTAWGLVRILPDGRQASYVPPPKRVQGIQDLHVDSAGQVWICWDHDVTVFRPRSLPTDGRIPMTAPKSRCSDASASALAAGESCHVAPPGSLTDFWFRIHASSAGIQLLGPHGLFDVRNGGLRPDETAAHFARSQLACVAEDRHGSLWIGTESGGLVRIARTGFWRYGTEDGLVNEHVTSIFEDAAGELCVTTQQWAIHRFDGAGFVGVRPALPRDITYPGWGWNQIALQDREGEWWYATGQGLARYPAVARLEDLRRTPPKKIYTASDGLLGNNIFRIFEDSRGDIWIATIGADQQGLSRWERSTGRIRQHELAPGQFPVTAFAEDASRNVWAGFYGGGLARYRGDRLDPFPAGGDIPLGLVSQILRDARGRLWASTMEQGLVRVDDPTADRPSFRAYGRTDGLDSERVYAITEDGAGNLYAANSRGIARLDPATGRLRFYTAAQGLASTAYDSALRDRHGRLWFGTSDGLFRLDPEAEPRAQPPRVFLRGLEVQGERVSLPAVGTGTLSLPILRHDRNQLRIEFASPALGAAERMRYRYVLQGRGGGWSRWSTDASVQYAALPAGRYRFVVEAVTADGVRSPEPASLEFRILAPPWRSPWFLAGLGLALAAFLIWLHRLRVARLLAVARVRARIAADLHDDLGTSLYRISILSELADRRIGTSGSDARRLLSEIGETARALIDSTGDMVWSVDPRRDDLASLATRVRAYASELLEAHGIEWTLELSPGAEKTLVGAQTRRQIYLVFKEALHNALRHGRPTRVTLRVSAADSHLECEIRDDGAGFASGPPARDDAGSDGYGLQTMRERARSLGADLRVWSAPGEGTRVWLRAPLSRDA